VACVLDQLVAFSFIAGWVIAGWAARIAELV